MDGPSDLQRNFGMTGGKTRARMRQSALVLGWIGIAAILYLSLVPGPMRPHTPASGYAEHFAAYCAVAFCLCFGTESALMRRLIVVALAVLSGALEVAQLSIEGRSGEVLGAIASSSGAAMGFAIAHLARQIEHIPTGR